MPRRSRALAARHAMTRPSLNQPHDIEVTIQFLPTEAGGKQKSVYSGYRPQFFYRQRDWDAVHVYPDVTEVRPGDTVRAYLWLPSPQLHVGHVRPGMPFLLREGNKTVGFGVVDAVLELEASAARITGNHST